MSKKPDIISAHNRHLVYVNVLHTLEKKYNIWSSRSLIPFNVNLCPLLRRTASDMGFLLDWNHGHSIRDLFPEIYKQKPWFLDERDQWWPQNEAGFVKRLAVLEKANRLALKKVSKL
jgi:hypothetical protein